MGAFVQLSERHSDELELSRLAWREAAAMDTVSQTTDFLAAVVLAKIDLAVELCRKNTHGHDMAAREALVDAALFMRDFLGDVDVTKAANAGLMYARIAAGRTA